MTIRSSPGLSESADLNLVLDEGNLLASVKTYRAEVGRRLGVLHNEKRDALGVIDCRTAAIDRLLIGLYQLAQKSYAKKNKGDKFRAVLVSQGGYGRRELCLHSDIDLLLLFEGRETGFVQHLNDNLFQILWDAGLEVGHAVRSVRDCRQLMDQDITILTSLIDARFLAGDAALFDEFQKMTRKYFSSKKNREKFLQKKVAENQERQEKYGRSIYLREPNLKEGEGGLRDHHSLYWLARVFDRIAEPKDLVARGYLTGEEFASLWKALCFLWLVRNELHRRTGRRSDQLVVEHQEPIAHCFGYENTEQFLGVENFMQQYYKNASIVRNLTEKAMRHLGRRDPELFLPPRVPLRDSNLRIVDGRLTVITPDLFEREPLYLLKVFDVSRRLGIGIDDVALERIQKSLGGIDDAFRTSEEAGKLFRDMLSRTAGLGKMLGEMNDAGVLGAFLPEFRKLHFRVQHDLYHVYTVDVHSIFAVTELGKLVAGEYAKSHATLTRIMQDMKGPQERALLAFAILYHDIGKGEGRGHVEKGAPIIRAAGARIGFSRAEEETLEFLERSHLIMTHVAFRRDLEEQNLIIQFAKAMQSLEILDMLYVLTFCDVKGVSAEAMTDWKASLLEYLYLKTRAVIQKGDFTKERASTLVPKILEETLSLLEKTEDRDKCREFFGIMSPRYLLATPPATIIRHVRLWERFAENPIVFEWGMIEKEALNEVTLFTWESPALFSRVAGLFAGHNVNIIEAQLNLTNQGHGLQVFKVTDGEGQPIPIEDEDKWRRIERDLRDVLEGRVPVENLVAEKFKPSLFKKKVARVVPAQVDIDNDVSPFYTVIDVYAHDRVGFLYQITSTLWALGLYVDVSKISTKVDQVADTFYVRDIFGHKITSQERLGKIREVVKKVIEEEPTPGWRAGKF